jgi:ribosomal protein S15P/S13E
MEKKFWTKSDSGLLIPSGTVSDFPPVSEKISLPKIGKLAVKLENLYNKYQVLIPSSSDLASLIKSAKELTYHLENNQKNKITRELIINTLFLYRIISAVLPIDGYNKVKGSLKKLTKKNLNIFNREKSNAKDKFCEIGIWEKLKKMGAPVDFGEPDIYWKEKGLVFGIACKKIYSDAHIQRITSKAVKQISQSTTYGMIAFNLDDLVVPENKILECRNETEGVGKLIEVGQNFLNKHQRHFKKYFLKNKLMGVIALTSCITHIDTYYIGSGMAVWSHSQLNSENKKRINLFKEKLQNNIP